MAESQSRFHFFRHVNGRWLWRKRDGLGAGDPKLLAAIGCWTGWRAPPLLVLIAASLGLIDAAI